MWSLWFYQHNLICSIKTDIVPPCIRSDVCEEDRIYTQGFVRLLEYLVNDSSWGEILLIRFYYSTCQTINWCSRRVLSAVLSVKKRKQQWKFRFVVRFLEKPQIFKCGAEIRLWNGLSLYNFMKWHEVVCFFKNWRVALTLFEIHICALRVLVWLEIIILLAPCGEKSICICHSFIVSFLQQLWLFLGKSCCSVFFAHATVTKRCQDHSDYGLRRLCFSGGCCFHYFLILFIFVPPLCWNPPCEGLLQEVLLLLGERCNRRGSKEYRPRDLHCKIHIYIFAGDGILVLSESTETE